MNPPSTALKDPSLLLIESSTKDFITEHLMDHIQKGNFTQKQRRDNDNIEMIPKNNIKLFHLSSTFVPEPSPDIDFDSQATFLPNQAEHNYPTDRQSAPAFVQMTPEE